MSLYDDLVITVDELLGDLGNIVNVTIITNGSYNTTSSTMGLTQSSFNTNAVVIDLSDNQQKQVESSTKKVLISGSAQVVTLGSKVIIDGTEYAVVAKKETRPAGTLVLQELYVI